MQMNSSVRCEILAYSILRNMDIDPHKRVDKSLSDSLEFPPESVFFILLSGFIFLLIISAPGTNLHQQLFKAIGMNPVMFLISPWTFFATVYIYSGIRLTKFCLDSHRRKSLNKFMREERSHFGVKDNWPSAFVIHSDQDELSIQLYAKLIPALYKNRVRAIIYSDFVWPIRNSRRIDTDLRTITVFDEEDNPAVAKEADLIIFLQCETESKGMRMELVEITQKTVPVVYVQLPGVSRRQGFKNLRSVFSLSSDMTPNLSRICDEISMSASSILSSDGYRVEGKLVQSPNIACC